MDKRPLLLVVLTLVIIVLFIFSHKKNNTVTVGFMSNSNSKEETVTVGSTIGTEDTILAQMLTILLEEYTDLNIEQKLGIGPELLAIHPVLLEGEIDMYPEFTGDAWYNILKQDIKINNADILYDQIKKKYKEEFNIDWLERYGYNSAFGLAMKRNRAEQLGIVSYSDLALKGSDLVFGAEHEFYKRAEGYTGLQEMYGFEFVDTKSLDFDKKYDAINEDEVDIITVFTTDGLIEEYDLVILDDDRNYFPIAEPATIIRGDTLEQYPQLKEVLNKLGGQISEEDIIALNALVLQEGVDTRDAAKLYLESKGLIKE